MFKSFNFFLSSRPIYTSLNRTISHIDESSFKSQFKQKKNRKKSSKIQYPLHISLPKYHPKPQLSISAPYLLHLPHTTIALSPAPTLTSIKTKTYSHSLYSIPNGIQFSNHIIQYLQWPLGRFPKKELLRVRPMDLHLHHLRLYCAWCGQHFPRQLGDYFLHHLSCASVGRLICGDSIFVENLSVD